MTAILSIIAVIVLAATLFFAGCKSITPVNKDGKQTTTANVISVKKLKSLSKAEIANMLDALEKSPSTPVVAAMCYRASSIAKFDFFEKCPVCGKKDKFIEENVYKKWEEDVKVCQKVIDKIRKEIGLDIELVISNLCRTCEDNGKQSKVKIRIKYSDGYVHEAQIRESKELIMLYNFLLGKTMINFKEFDEKTENDPLQETVFAVRAARNLIGAYETDWFYRNAAIEKIHFLYHEPGYVAISLDIAGNDAKNITPEPINKDIINSPLRSIIEIPSSTTMTYVRVGDAIGKDKQFTVTEIATFYIIVQKKTKDEKGNDILETITIDREKK